MIIGTLYMCNVQYCQYRVRIMVLVYVYRYRVIIEGAPRLSSAYRAPQYPALPSGALSGCGQHA